MRTLAPSEIHLWQARVEDFDYRTLLSNTLPWLSGSEQTRLQRFYFETHKAQLLLGRYLLRSVLSQYADIQPQQWQFSYNDYGKPSIANSLQQDLPMPLYFNLSHSKGMLVLAVSQLEETGVDIECNLPPRRVAKIANRYFSTAEVDALSELTPSQQQKRFYDLWSLKEAYIKACGLGLAIPLNDFSYQFLSNQQLSLDFVASRQDDPKRWQLWQIDSLTDFNIALAVKSRDGKQIQSLAGFKFLEGDRAEMPLSLRRSN